MQSLVGMSAYDSEAMLIGKVEQIGLRKVGGGGNAHITIKIGEKEVPWDGISKIGDIILLKTAEANPAAGSWRQVLRLRLSKRIRCRILCRVRHQALATTTII